MSRKRPVKDPSRRSSPESRELLIERLVAAQEASERRKEEHIKSLAAKEDAVLAVAIELRILMHEFNLDYRALEQALDGVADHTFLYYIANRTRSFSKRKYPMICNKINEYRVKNGKGTVGFPVWY